MTYVGEAFRGPLVDTDCAKGYSEGMESACPPFLDAQLEYIGVRAIRTLTIEALRDLKRPLVVMPLRENVTFEPLAVIISYEQYLAMQQVLVWASLLPNGPMSNVGQASGASSRVDAAI